MLELKAAAQATVRFDRDSFALLPDGFFDEGQVVADVLFADADGLGHVPDRHGALHKMGDDVLPDGLLHGLEAIAKNTFRLQRSMGSF